MRAVGMILQGSVISGLVFTVSCAYLSKPSETKNHLGPPAQDVKTRVEAEVVSAYGKLPLSFIKNEGQVDLEVEYYEKGSGHATYFTKEGIYLSMTKRDKPRWSEQEATGSESITAVVKLVPLGAVTVNRP